MYHFSRAIYRELAPYVLEEKPPSQGETNRELFLRACERTMARLLMDQTATSRCGSRCSTFRCSGRCSTAPKSTDTAGLKCFNGSLGLRPPRNPTRPETKKNPSHKGPGGYG